MFWVDVRIFLALVRSGSVRAAASAAGVSHATVARRVDAFETRLGIKLFDRLPIGYLLTPAGEDLLEVAEKVEDEFDAVQRRLAGVIRVTMIDVNATHLLMPDIVAFNELYPDIELEICMTHEPLDLRRRETDVAIRFVKTLPEYLIGRRLATVAYAAYASQAYVDEHDLSGPTSASWMGYDTLASTPKWVKQSDYPHLPAKGVLDGWLL